MFVILLLVTATCADGAPGDPDACTGRRSTLPLSDPGVRNGRHRRRSSVAARDDAYVGVHLLMALICVVASAIACSGVTLPVSIMERLEKIASST